MLHCFISRPKDLEVMNAYIRDLNLKSLDVKNWIEIIIDKSLKLLFHALLFKSTTFM